jgi:hypothetical protein
VTFPPNQPRVPGGFKARRVRYGNHYHREPSVQVDRYLLETLMPDLVGHDRQPSAFLVYLLLWAETAGGERPVEISLGRIAGGTGLSKRTVQDAVAHLVRRELVSTERESITAVARYDIHRPWRRHSPEA